MSQEELISQLRAFEEKVQAEIQEGQLIFPTVMDLSLRIKRVSDSPESSIETIARIVKTEPLLSAKAVRLANTAVKNPYGKPISNVSDAVSRIGMTSLRCLAFAVSAEQISQDMRSRELRRTAAQLWVHTVDVASWSYAIALQTRSSDPDTALFAGMVANIGQFFLLSRASDYPALTDSVPGFAKCADAMGAPVTRAILEVLQLPGEIVDACSNEAELRFSGALPGTLPDTISLATAVAQSPNPFASLLRERLPLNSRLNLDSESAAIKLRDMLTSAKSSRTEMLAAVCG